MTGDDELASVRAAYAKRILDSVRVDDPRIEAAFAAVRREDFLGPGPWPIFQVSTGTYVPTPSDDPAYLYSNDLVGIVPEQRINNGQPSLHAYLLGHARAAEGEHIVHIGTGAGYYTAIMAHIAGRSGRVTGIEFEPALAARARANLSSCPNVQIVEGDGALAPFDTADVIYVNAGATRPAEAWLDRLAEGGRLILPLTTEKGFNVPRDMHTIALHGAVFLIERRGSDYFAKWIAPVAIYPCAGNRDLVSQAALAAALDNGRMRDVTRLYRHESVPAEDRWLSGPGWSLAYR